MRLLLLLQSGDNRINSQNSYIYLNHQYHQMQTSVPIRYTISRGLYDVA